MEGCPLLLSSTLVLSSLSPYWLSVIIYHNLLHVALIEHMDHHKGGRNEMSEKIRGTNYDKEKIQSDENAGVEN